MTAFQSPTGAELVEEKRRFQELMKKLPVIYKNVFPHRVAPRTVVIVPSSSVDQEVLAKVTGVHHYEERMLCLLILLRLPRTNIVFLTSQPIHDSIVDYYLHLLPGVPSKHARSRLAMLSCHDASPVPLTQKILERPRLIHRIKALITNPDDAHMTCFNSSPLERSLAVKLGIPLYACDPDLIHLGSKSEGRAIFKEAGVPTPDGIEHLNDENDVFKGLAELKDRNPELRRAVIKLNHGFSGEGNAIFDYDPAMKSGRGLEDSIRTDLPRRIKFEASGMGYPAYMSKFDEMGGVVEAWIDGEIKHSPSAQVRIDPLGGVNVFSTHDQVLGGPTGQIYLGCSFPAREDYRLDIQEAGNKIGAVMKSRGVLNLFGIDFVSVKSPDGWKHFAIEINLRKGGTTFPYLVLEFLTVGKYDRKTGLFRLQTGEPRYYYATDNFQKPMYHGLTPDDLIDTMVYYGLHFDSTRQTGTVFHLMGALSEFGKFGVTCIDKDPKSAFDLYKRTMNALDHETGSYEETDQ